MFSAWVSHDDWFSSSKLQVFWMTTYRELKRVNRVNRVNHFDCSVYIDMSSFSGRC